MSLLQCSLTNQTTPLYALHHQHAFYGDAMRRYYICGGRGDLEEGRGEVGGRGKYLGM